MHQQAATTSILIGLCSLQSIFCENSYARDCLFNFRILSNFMRQFHKPPRPPVRPSVHLFVPYELEKSKKRSEPKMP